MNTYAVRRPAKPKPHRPEKEAIHSGQFMVSHFEAEAQDDEDNVAVPVPEEVEIKSEIVPIKVERVEHSLNHKQLIGIDTSLSKLFQCMSLAYRQKLTSPKWNRFRGIRLTWKDKIRLNNVIWRCWHMQFIKKQNTLICQFASPLDVDTHNKPEAVVLEGKYWKRKLAAVTAEYKKWRMFFRNQVVGNSKDTTEILSEMEMLAWSTQNIDENMMVDEDYMGLMSDTLFSTITNQPFQFPDSREIAKAGLADFIQPSLGPLQPNLDDYMDTFEPLHDLISGKLTTVQEEHHDLGIYPEVDMMHYNSNMQVMPQLSTVMSNYQQLQPMPLNKPPPMIDNTRQIQNYQVVSRADSFNGASAIYNQSMISKEQQYNKVSPNQFVAYPEISPQPEPRIQELQQPSLNNFKMDQEQNAIGYKFTPPVTPNVKFTSQISSTITQKEEKQRARNASGRGRQRSLSNSRESKKPPLVSTASDSFLLRSTNSALLTQLLTNTENNPAFSQRLSGSHETNPLIRVKDESTAAAPVPILPQPAPATLIITTPVNMAPVHSLSITDPLLLNTASASNSPVLDTASQSLNSPTSSQGSLGSPTRENRGDQRRAGHIHAEQIRRYNIKNGFDMIHSLIPHLNQNPNAKLSKAAMLQKGAEYIKQLRQERNALKDEMDSLRQQIESLNTSISNCQSLLPATGAPVSRRRDNKMQKMFDDYVRTRTMEDWKFWIFSLLFRPLLSSFNNFVATTSVDDLYRSTMVWVEQHCTLADLRPLVLNSLRYLCTRTDILSEPEKLPEEARQVVLSGQQQ